MGNCERIQGVGRNQATGGAIFDVFVSHGVRALYLKLTSSKSSDSDNQRHHYSWKG